MAIWSLTKERIDKILSQIADKEAEIDALIKLSKEDLWKKDLDEFINEWRFQLAEEARLEKKVQNMGRRVSSKLRTQVKPAGRKRKGGDDSGSESDFLASKSKKAPAPKSTLSKVTSSSQPKQTSITQAFKKPIEALKVAAQPDADVWMDVDKPVEADSDAPVATKAKAKAAAEPKKKAPVKIKKAISDDEDDETPAPVPKKGAVPKSKAIKVDSDEEEDEVIRSAAPAVTRAPRAATRKPIKYVGTSGSDSDNGDDMLFDVGKMVKGIPGSLAEASRPLFSASNGLPRPTSSADYAARKSASGKTPFADGDDDVNDETDYALLAPTKAKTAKSTVLSDDEEDSFELGLSKAPVSKTVPAPRARAGSAQPTTAPKANVSKTVVPKKPSAPPLAAIKEKKPQTLSPAAKAYAKKQLKDLTAKKALDFDDDGSDAAMEDVDKVVDDMLSDDDSVIPAKPAPKPKGRAGSVQSLSKSIAKPVAKPAAKPVISRTPSVEPTIRRPARAAAGRAAASKPKAFVFSDDDDEDEDEAIEDEASEVVSEDESVASAFSE